MNDIRIFIKNMLQSVFKTKVTNTEDITSPVVLAIKNKEVVPAKDIAKPIVTALVDVMKEIREKEGVEIVSVKNIEEARTDLSEVLAYLKTISEKEEKEVIEKVIDTSEISKTLKQIEEKISSIKFPEIKFEKNTDYSEYFDAILEKLNVDDSEDKETSEYSSIVTAINSLKNEDHSTVLFDWLRAIHEKEQIEYPFEFDKGRLKVSVDRVGGGGVGGLTSIESEYIANIETNQTNGLQLTKITDGAGVVNTKILGDDLVDGDVALVTNTVVHGYCTSHGGEYVDVKVTHSGALEVNINTADGEISSSSPLPIANSKYAKIVDFASGTVTYIGWANPGSATATAAWRVQKIVDSGTITITWADGNSNFDNVWDNRASLTYL